MAAFQSSEEAAQTLPVRVSTCHQGEGSALIPSQPDVGRALLIILFSSLIVV